MQNKKGLVPAIIIPIAIAIIALILVGAFLFSGTLRIILIGVGIFAGVIYLLGTIKSDKVKIISILVLLVVGVLFASGVLQEYEFEPTFIPRYCRDYEFTCCGETIDYTLTSKTITDETYFFCHYDATRCVIESVDGASYPEQTYIGSSDCYLKTGLFGVQRWYCSNEVGSTRKTLLPGEYIWVMNRNNKYSNQEATLNTVQVWEKRLAFCGKSGTVGPGISCGVKVLGTDACHYNPEGTYIYEDTGTKISVPEMYEVPLHDCILSWQGQRTICGNLEETCETDGDCIGYEFGNQECDGRTLLTYGCVKFGEWDAPEYRDRLVEIDADFGQTDTSIIGGQRCDVIPPAITVQCCGGGDCGPGLFCDTNPDSDTAWLCKPDVECRQDSDCGVEIICDWTTKELVTPFCNLQGDCDEKRTSVDCCNDGNCQSGYYCTADYKCEKSITPCQQCSFECCIDQCTKEGGYYDRPCATGEFCIDGTCSSTPECNGKDCPEGEECIDGVCKTKLGPEACLQKAIDQLWMGWEWVTVTPWWGDIPVIGYFAKEEAYCKATFLIYYILGGIFLVLGTITILLLRKPKYRNKGGRR